LVIGMSTPSRAASSRTALAQGTPSATWPSSADDRVQGLALRQAEADAAVARQVAGAGEDQVAHAGQAHEGFRLPAQRGAQAGDFGQAARDQRGARVQPQAQAVGHAGGDGQHVLDRAAHFHADQVVAANRPARCRRAWPVTTQSRSAADSEAMVSAHGRPRATSCANDGPDSAPLATVAQHFAHDLVRQQAGAVFEALAQPDHVGDGVVRFQLFQQRAQAGHRAGRDQQPPSPASVGHGGVEVGFDRKAGGKRKPGR
jgi:hypothetical protein